MGTFSTSYGLSRIVAAENDILVQPRTALRGRRGVVFLPGQLQIPLDWNSSATPEQRNVFQYLARLDVYAAVINAGVASWGNDTAVADIDLARLDLASRFGCASDKIIIVGASAGALDALNYARANPGRVAGIVGIMPASDLDDIRDNDRGGAQANINTAWGMPGGSTSGTDPLPARANPNTVTNAALIVSQGCAVRLYYSSADAVVLAATVVSLAAKLGIEPTLISASVAHSDALFADVPRASVASFIASKI